MYADRAWGLLGSLHDRIEKIDKPYKCAHDNSKNVIVAQADADALCALKCAMTIWLANFTGWSCKCGGSDGSATALSFPYTSGLTPWT